jgi:hypothetical protein
MYSVPLSRTAFRRCLLIASIAFSANLVTGCRDYLAPEPVEDIPDWVVEVGRKATSPEIIGPRSGSHTNKSVAADPNSSAISR